MTRKPMISIIIPIYNVQLYIERCARSLMEQTLQEIEYIFVNDCTPDSSIDILETVIAEYPNRMDQVKIINLPKNQGLPSARKEGVLIASGEYIAHCDSDDWMDTDALRLLYEKTRKGNVDIVFCDFYRSDGYNHVPEKKYGAFNDKFEFVKSLMTAKLMGTLWGSICKRDLYENVIFPKDNYTEDITVLIQLVCNSSQGIEYVDVSLYYYYINRYSISHKDTDIACYSRFVQAVNNTNIVLDFLENRNLSSQFCDTIICFKLISRNQLGPISNKMKYRRIFFNTYPEINSKIWFCKSVSMIRKIRFIVVALGLYSLFDKLRNL